MNKVLNGRRNSKKYADLFDFVDSKHHGVN